MSTATERTLKPARSYLKLVRRFPLRPIGSETEYDAAIAALFPLSEKAETMELDPGEKDYLDALSHFIQRWDEEQGHLNIAKLTPLDVLAFLMEQHDLNISDLGRIIGSQSAASLILNGKRELSKTHIRTLSTHFHVDPGLFF